MIKNLKAKYNILLLIPAWSVILFHILPAALVAQYDASSLYNELNKKIENVSTISLKFTVNGQTGFKGALKAKKGNKFIIETPANKIICDGKTIWNYSESEKKVVINNYEQNSQGSSVEKFFFSFFQKYKPQSLKKETSSKGKFSYILGLIPDTKVKDQDLFKEVKIWLSTDNLSIQRLQFDDGSNKQTWNLSNLNINPSLSDKSFRFIPPKDIEIIDLR